MSSSYPNLLHESLTKRDFQDPIFAAHFNAVQEEVFATQKTVGIKPQIALNDPAQRTKDYLTVTTRMQSAARGEPMIAYRGTATAVQVPTNEYFRPALVAVEDTHAAASGTGFVVPQTGYWVLTAKADWPSTSQSAATVTTRVLAIEINGVDIGLRDTVLEDDKNRDHMTTAVTWPESLAEGTHISVVLHVVNGDPTKTPAPANVYLRAHIVRCLDRVGTGLPSPVFQADPPPPPSYPSGPQPTTGPAPQTEATCGPPYVYVWSPGAGKLLAVDSCGHYVSVDSPGVSKGIATSDRLSNDSPYFNGSGPRGVRY